MAGRGLLIAVALGVGLSAASYADLQKIQVGGEIKIRGNYWSEEWFDQGPVISRGPLASLFGRAIPDAVGFAPPLTPGNGIPFLYVTPGLGGTIKFDDQGNSVSNVEQRTRVNVRATFTDGVSAFIELDSYDTWGEANEFRSDYITGVDGRANSSDDVQVFQAYIEMEDVLGYEHFDLRIGRQEIELRAPGGIEEGWLVSNVDAGLFFGGVSFDGIRFDYTRELGDYDFGLTGFWTKLAETSPLEEDGDVDFYGAEARFSRFGDNLSSELALYWLFLRDARSREENPYLFQGSSPLGFFTNPRHNFAVETLENIFDFDQHEPTTMHTLGTRLWGTYFPDSLAWELEWKGEFAYQFGDASAIAFTQIPVNNVASSIIAGPLVGPTIPFFRFTYGESDAEFDTYGADLSLMFTPVFGVQYLEEHPTRIRLRFTYYDGEDNSDITFWERINPLSKREASVSFNRLFSEDEHSDFLDIEGNLSNVWIAKAEVTTQITDEVRLGASASYFEVVDEFERSPYGPFWDGLLRTTGGVGFLGLLSPITRTSDADLGWEAAVDIYYQYSQDLSFSAGWTHFFAGDGIEDGNFVDLNGLGFAGGLDDADADYLWFQTSLQF